MAIRTVITRGYGNGTFNGTIGLVVTRGYVTHVAGSRSLTLSSDRAMAYSLGARDIGLTVNSNRDIDPVLGERGVGMNVSPNRTIDYTPSGE